MSAQERVLRIRAHLVRERLAREREKFGHHTKRAQADVDQRHENSNDYHSSSSNGEHSSCERSEMEHGGMILSSSAASSTSASVNTFLLDNSESSSSTVETPKKQHRRDKSQRRHQKDRGGGSRRKRDLKDRHGRRHRNIKNELQTNQRAIAQQHLRTRNETIARFRKQLQIQQNTMLEVLNGLDNQLQAHMELRQREDFQRRLEDHIVGQNKALLEALENRLLKLPLSQAGGIRSESPLLQQNASHGSLTSLQPNQTSLSGKYPSAPERNPVNEEHSGSSPAKQPGATTEKALSNTTSKIDSIKVTKPPDEENRTIWEKLLDDDTDLLQVSDDEADKVAAKDEKKEVEEAERSRKVLKVIVYGSGKPLYRWRKEGVTAPPADQILKGKPLFRAIATVFIALARIRRDAEMHRAIISQAERKDMDKAVIWFADLVRSWTSQVLALQLTDIASKKDLNLNPSGGLSAFGTKGMRMFRGKKTAPVNANGEKVDETNLARLRLKVRVRGVFESLLRSIETDKPPFPAAIASFLGKLVTDGSVFPDGFLFPIEHNSLDFGASGYTRWMIREKEQTAATKASISEQITQSAPNSNPSLPDEELIKPEFDYERSKLILSTFVIIRCLLPVLCRPWEMGIVQKPEKRAQANLTILASVVYVLLRKTIGGPEQGQPNDYYTKAADSALISRMARRESFSTRQISTDLGSVADDVATAILPSKTSASGERKSKSRWLGFGRQKNKISPQATQHENINAAQISVEPAVSAAASLLSNANGGQTTVGNKFEQLQTKKQEEEEEEEEEEQRVRHAGIETYLGGLLPDKQLSEILNQPGFLSEILTTYNRCILRLLQKAFEAAEDVNVPEDLLQEIEVQNSQLMQEKLSKEARSVLKRRNDEMKARRIEKEEEEQRKVEEEARAKEGSLARQPLAHLQGTNGAETGQDEGAESRESDSEGDEDNEDDDDEDDDEDDEDEGNSQEDNRSESPLSENDEYYLDEADGNSQEEEEEEEEEEEGIPASSSYYTENRRDNSDDDDNNPNDDDDDNSDEETLQMTNTALSNRRKSLSSRQSQIG